MNTEPEMDKTALADNVQRTVERTALRKVRKLVDELEGEQVAESKLEWRALIIASVIGTVIAVGFVLYLIGTDQQFERDQKINLPEKIVVPKKD